MLAVLGRMAHARHGTACISVHDRAFANDQKKTMDEEYGEFLLEDLYANAWNKFEQDLGMMCRILQQAFTSHAFSSTLY